MIAHIIALVMMVLLSLNMFVTLFLMIYDRIQNAKLSRRLHEWKNSDTIQAIQYRSLHSEVERKIERMRTLRDTYGVNYVCPRK